MSGRFREMRDLYYYRKLLFIKKQRSCENVFNVEHSKNNYLDTVQPIMKRLNRKRQMLKTREGVGNSYMQRLINFRRLGYKSRVLVSLRVLTTKHHHF